MGMVNAEQLQMQAHGREWEKFAQWLSLEIKSTILDSVTNFWF